MSYGEANKENKENGGAMMETQKGNMEAIIRKVLFQDQRIRVSSTIFCCLKKVNGLHSVQISVPKLN